jgi:hypothetical protein
MSARVAMVAVVAGLLAGTAQAQACPLPVIYPGDAAPKEQIAQWMAHRALAAGLPAELPVMGGLAESGLKNVQAGDADSVGFFHMRLGIWNQGKYAGYPDEPDLQLQWFVDYATQARQARIAAGRPDPLLDETMWGDWVADVLRPAEQYRYRYQLRLVEARGLIGPPCGDDGSPGTAGTGSGSGTGTGPPLDTLPPVVRLAGATRQRALHRGAVVVLARCPMEGCTASATATLRVPGTVRAFRLAARKRALPAGQLTPLRLLLDARLRAAVRRAVHARRTLMAKVVVTVADGAGNATTAARTVRITG